MPAASIQPGFHAIHANHLEDLRRAVVWICQQSPLPPLESETFLVQSNGIAQWLKLALAEDPSGAESGDDNGGMGIAAGMDFLFPARFIWQAYRAVLTPAGVPEQSPFDKSRLVWRLFRLLPHLIAEDGVFAPLQRFMAGADTETRRYQLAGKIADLFDQYQVFRADWLADWEAGHDRLQMARGEYRELGEELRWQPVLWRKLVEDVSELAATSRSRIHTRFMEEGQKLKTGDRPADLPRRIVVFGVSSLPKQALEALSILSRVSQVVLCVHNPSEFYWADIISDRDLLNADRKRGQAHPKLAALTDPDDLHQHANPLLAAWGKQGRDYIRLLDEFDNPEEYRGRVSTPDGRIDIFTPHGDPQQPVLLHQIQDDIRTLTSQPEMLGQGRSLDPFRDGSVVFHNAHSPQREVEILHDQLLAAFNANPELRPRDVIVMVPDVDTYAPHIQAVFGRYPPSSRRYIPFTISDQGQRHRQPVLIALDTLMALPESRFGVSEIVSLLEVPAVRNRFGIAEGDLPLVRQWVEGANIRWGLHSDHRGSLDLPDGLERNTWQAGLRRMLLGYGTGRDEPWQGIEPYDEIGGLQASVAGNLCRFIDRLEDLWHELRGSATPAGWLELLQSILERFFADLSDDELLLVNRLRRQAEQWLQDCDSAGMEQVELPLNIVREILLEGLEEGGLNQRFLAGKVNFATLMPMRAIPFRRVCLLGMNDGDYPRSRPPVDFDLMALDYRPGDRSRREDDRYLFLEALLSAREQLYISWVGRSIRDDSERPPSVLVSQLRDHLDAVWQVSGSEQRASAAVTIEHPLQPFSREYFPAGNRGDTADAPANVHDVLSGRRLFTYDSEWLSAHQAPKAEAEQVELSYLPPADPITLGELGAFLKRPVEVFYQRRLQVRFADVENLDTDNEAFAMDGLQHWRLEDELIRHAVMKADTVEALQQYLDDSLASMARRGELGMGLTEYALAQQLESRMPDLHRRYQEALALWPEAIEEVIGFEAHHKSGADTVDVSDRLGNLRTRPDGSVCRVVIASSNLLEGPRGSRQLRFPALLDHWVSHLAGNLRFEAFHTLVIAKEEQRVVNLLPMEKAAAGECLATLLDYWMQGQTQPLPVESAAAFAYLRGLYPARGEGNEDKALQKAEEAYNKALARDSGYLHRAYPEFAQLLASGQFPLLVSALYEPLWHAEQAGRVKPGGAKREKT
ncbi:exodeoxyribonuclease V subunit gamma [Marinobacter vulgaris]|uniref:RecBCD enzyme subunit RecC n=1 Tax=Marinobacter vulgaris TaxID=1928331 RepID=A0A2V3ZN74_9GAMM|nr:exodeoxyribonuclease V subunit gamma [Marinobacter vulgaris]PXX92431.1 exodeoxyribonuclease V subunit gamma [Marinobacter vulgaris]TSJ71627.1 exodeoxyribonuclease V subunit gamma [Marinobacter vulgaris]